MPFRSMLRAWIAFFCLFLLFEGRLVFAQTADGLDDIASRLHQKKVLAIFQIKALDRFAKEVLASFSKTPSSSPEEQMGRHLLSGVISTITRMDVDLGRGAVFAVQALPIPQKRLPVGISAWLWLKQTTGLQGLMQMLPFPASRVLSFQDANTETYLIRVQRSPKAPLLLVVREGLLVRLSAIAAPPRMRDWWGVLQGPISWAQTQSMVVASLSSPEQSPLSGDVGFQAARKRHAGSMFFLYTNLQNVADFAEMLGAKVRPILSVVRGYLGAFDAGADVSLLTGTSRVHEHLSFGPKGNPLRSIFATSSSPLNLARILPANADWISCGQLDLGNAFKTLQRLVVRFAPRRRVRRIRREIRDAKEMFKAFFGLGLFEALAFLNGQVASFVRVDPKALPFVETMANMGFLLGVHDAKKSSAFLEQIFALVLEKRILRGKRIAFEGQTIYQIEGGKTLQLYSAMSGRAWLWTADLSTLQALLRQTSQQAVWEKRLAASPNLFLGLQQGKVLAWGNGNKLPQLVHRFPLPPKDAALVRQQISRFQSFSIVAEHTATAWSAETQLRFTAPTKVAATKTTSPTIQLRSLRRRGLRRLVKQKWPFLLGLGGVSIMPLMMSPSFSMGGVVGIGAGFFLFSAMPMRAGRGFRRKRAARAWRSPRPMRLQLRKSTPQQNPLKKSPSHGPAKK